MQAEIIALRHQLTVLQRRQKPRISAGYKKKLTGCYEKPFSRGWSVD